MIAKASYLRKEVERIHLLKTPGRWDKKVSHFLELIPWKISPSSTNYNAFNKTVLPISTLHIISHSTQPYKQQKILLMSDVKTFRDYVPYFRSIDP